MVEKGPASIRSPRTRAVEIGTDPRGFEATDYCPQCGHPIKAGLPHSHYVEQEPSLGPGAAPIQSVPMTVKE
jgi:hypothetical protein